jgi:sugar phosphate isomerase/epimerase
MTDPSKFNELFIDSIHHIEIGEFSDQNAFEKFLAIKSNKKVSLGLHSPLYRTGSKYDLLEHVFMEPENAWVHFENEIKMMSELGAEYVLVHFPYFQSEGVENSLFKIEVGLKRLRNLQDKYNMVIVCEPKLGLNRSSVNIDLLHQFPIEKWAKYNIKLCIDIGDYLIGAKEKTERYIRKWRDYIKVVHLHNVEFTQDKYIWIPVHPTHEEDGIHFNVQTIIGELAKCKEEVIFVFEHTPHSNPTREFVTEGIKWVDGILAAKSSGEKIHNEKAESNDTQI